MNFGNTRPPGGPKSRSFDRWGPFNRYINRLAGKPGFFPKRRRLRQNDKKGVENLL